MNSDTKQPGALGVAQIVVEGPDTVDYDQLFAASNGLRDPVLLSGMHTGGAATETWTLDRLLALEPDTPVTAEYYFDADRRKPYEHIVMPFTELAAAMAADPEKWYIAELNFDEVFPKVAAELQRLSVLPDDARSVLRLVFFGTNSASATHFHVRDQAILSHLKGEKRVILAGPKATGQLATNSKFGGRPQFSTHGPEAGADALECFTDLCGSEAVQVDIVPGDALFIPVQWWHWVEGRGENLSVTTFWRASLREWAFPHPGIRSAVAVGLGETAKVVRGVTGRFKNAK